MFQGSPLIVLCSPPEAVQHVFVVVFHLSLRGVCQMPAFLQRGPQIQIRVEQLGCASARGRGVAEHRGRF